MVYKRYIKKKVNGKIKTYGPYYQHSKKENGKVISEYHGKKPKKELNKKSKELKFVRMTIFLVSLLILSFVFLSDLSLTGKATLSLSNNYAVGEEITGSVKINLDSGELLPADTTVLIENGGETYSFLLSDLISEETSEGNYYILDKEISGSGSGYGIVGEKIIYPKVNFVMSLSYSENAEENTESSGGSQIQEGVEEETSEEIEEEIESEESVEENVEEVSEEPSEVSSEVSSESVEESSESEESSAPITGEAVSDSEIDGTTSYDKPYEYNLNSGQTASIVSSEQDVELNIEDRVAIVTTDYYEVEEGFGEGYVSDDGLELEIGLTELNLIAVDGNLNIKLVYDDVEIISASEEINVEDSEKSQIKVNQTIINELDEKVLNETIAVLNETVENDTIEINEFVSANLNTTQFGAVVGMPVKWKKNIKLSEVADNLTVELPKEAENIVVYKIEDNDGVVEGKTEASSFITGQISAEIDSDGKSIVDFFKKIFGSITGRAIDVSESSDKVEVTIEENATEFEIEYETPAPVAFEQETSSGKLVTISSDVHYENILSFAELPRETSLSDIKLYHYVNGQKVLTDFQAYDSNGNLIGGDEVEVILEDKSNKNKSVLYGSEDVEEKNVSIKDILMQAPEAPTSSKESNNSSTNESVGLEEEIVEEQLVSFITWVVPHLSDQTYEIVIEISKAEHLDSDRNFIEDIYNEVSVKDDVWSKVIEDSEYVRVTFEELLDSFKDITVYARGQGSIEVYLEDGDEVIATIDDISEEGEYKTYLTEMQGEHDVFDLKILGNLEFDLIIDPSYNPNNENDIGYEFLTIDGNITNASDGEVVHIWNTQDDYFFNKSAGIQLTNHFQDYWTRNIFCIGYYNATDIWNKIYCADELSDFNRNIETDNSTYVNATLWKDISYGAYDLRLGIRYYLGVDDQNLSVIIYAKNIGIDIPFDLGFAWKITDWNIPPYTQDDRITINNTNYFLNGTYNLEFENMDEAYLRGYDPTIWTEEFLRLDWNNNLDYKVKMYGDGNQENFYTALLINGGHFNPDQEKQTTLYWIDAVSLGTNSGFVEAAPTSDPGGIGSTLDNNALGTRDTSPATATRITEIGWWCDTATEESNFEVGIYEDTGSNYPGDVVGSLYQTNAKGTDAGWKTVSVDISISPSTSYWIAVQVDDTATNTNTDVALTGGDYRVLKPGESTLTDPFVAGASTNSGYAFAFYALWDTGGGDVANPTVALNEPADFANYTSATTDLFNCTVFDDVAVDTVLFYWNVSGSWEINGTDTSGTNNTKYEFSRDINQEGEFHWGCWANDTSGNSTWSSANRTFSYRPVAEGDYLNINFNISEESGELNNAPEGITQNNTFIWIADSGDAEVYKYYMNGTYTQDSFDTSGAGASIQGVTQNNTFIWIADDSDNAVYKYYMNGTYTQDSFDISGSGNTDAKGLWTNNTFIWIADSGDAEVYKYYMNGTYTQDSFDTSGAGATDPRGVSSNYTHFYIADLDTTSVYIFKGPGVQGGDVTNPTVALNEPADFANYTYAKTDLFNCTVFDDVAVDTVLFYWNVSGSWEINGTNTTGVNNSKYSFSRDINQLGEFHWACWANDTSGNELWSSSNYTFSYRTPVEGDYLGISFDTAVASNSDPFGITNNDTFIWITDSSDAEVYKYYMNGTYTQDSFDTNANGHTEVRGITNNGTYFWIVDNDNDILVTYYMNGTYTGTFSNLSSDFGADTFTGVVQNGTFIWISDDTDNEVYKLYMNGTYTGDHFDTQSIGSYNPQGITTNNTFLWLVDSNTDEVYKFYMNGTYTQRSFDASLGGSADTFGITHNETWFWITDITSDEVYIFKGPGVQGGDVANPTVTLNEPADATNYTSVQDVIFNCTVFDDVAVQNVTFYWNVSGTFEANGTDSSGTNNTKYSFTRAISSEGHFVWNCLAFDTSSNSSYAATNYTFNLTLPSADTTAPTFTGIPSNVSGNYLTANVNADFDFTDETAISMIFINDTSNFTMDNSTGILTNKTPLFVGNYSLNVTINDSSNNINWTIFTIQVNKSSNACQVLFNETSPITYPAQFQAYSDCDSDFTLYLNGSAISNDSVVDSGAGTYNISVQRTDLQNYSNTFDDEYFVVSQNSDVCGIYFNASSGITFPETFIVYTNCSSAYTLSLNGTSISNATEIRSGAGAFNLSVLRTDASNYSSYYSEEEFQVAKGTLSASLTSSKTFSYEYDNSATTINLSESNTHDSDVNYTIYRDNVTYIPDGEEVNFAVGTYEYIVNSTGGQNYSSNSIIDLQVLTITQNSEVCQVLFNETSPITYPQTFLVWANCSSAFTLYQNGSTIANNSEVISGAGAFNFSFLRTDASNYSTYYNETQFIVSQDSSICGVEFNETSPVNYPATFLVWSNCSSANYLMRNGTIISNNSEQSLSVGAYNFSTNRTDTSNYSSIYSERQFRVIDIIGPTITILYPLNTSYENVTEINYTSSESGYCMYSFDDGTTNSTASASTSNFTGVSSSAGQNDLVVYCNDSSNNFGVNNTISFTVDIISPQVTIALPVLGNTYTSALVTFQVTTDEESTCNYSIDAAVTNSSMTASSGGTIHTASASLSDGSYTVNYFCADLYSNLNNSESTNFSVAISTPPVEETPSGGGGGATRPVTTFGLSSSSFEKTLAVNRIGFGDFEIENPGSAKRTYSFEVETINSIVQLEENSVEINPGEKVKVGFKVISPDEPGIYTGKIIVKTGSVTKEILLTINVKTEKSLFDVVLTIPKTMKALKFGNNLYAQIDLLEMGLKEKKDITLNYMIKDFDGVVYLTESETIAVTDQKTLQKEFYTADLPPGDYILGTEVIYPEGVAVSSSQFKVREKIGFEIENTVIIILVAIFLILFISIALIIRRYRKILKAVK